MTRLPKDPPAGLSAVAAEEWRSLVAGGMLRPDVTQQTLSIYCNARARLHEVTERISEEGLVVDGGRGPVTHPLLNLERQLQEGLRQWAETIFRRPAARRRGGRLHDATRQAIDAAPHLADNRFAAIKEAALLTAFLVDEEQRNGANPSTSRMLLANYTAACEALGITPATVQPTQHKKPGGRLLSFQDAAARRRDAGQS